MDGPATSSTSSETWSITAALLLPTPVHIGTDSRAALATLERILRGDTGLNKRPWATRTDGDAWECVQELVLQRGVGSVKCTRVKGHATAQMVAEGRVSEADRRGNACADAAVNKGYLTYHSSRRDLAALHDQMLHAYCELVVAIRKAHARHPRQDASQ